MARGTDTCVCVCVCVSERHVSGQLGWDGYVRDKVHIAGEETRGKHAMPVLCRADCHTRHGTARKRRGSLCAAHLLVLAVVFEVGLQVDLYGTARHSTAESPRPAHARSRARTAGAYGGWQCNTRARTATTLRTRRHSPGPRAGAHSPFPPPAGHVPSRPRTCQSRRPPAHSSAVCLHLLLRPVPLQPHPFYDGTRARLAHPSLTWRYSPAAA